MADFQLEMTVTIDYNTNGADKGDLVENLHSIMKHAAGAGAIAGFSPAEVVTWDVLVAGRMSDEL